MEKLLSPNEWTMMQGLIADKLGIILGDEKAYLLENKMSNLLSRAAFRNFEELYTHLIYKNDLQLMDEMIDAITVNETFWFRDRTPWLIMEELLLPKYISEFREGKREVVRIWSGACSYGQEPYSIAMCIESYLKAHDIHDLSLNHFEIVATDLSNTVLQKARMGEYDAISMERGMDQINKSLYFKNVGKTTWRIQDPIRNAVQFQQLNLLKEFFPYHKYDIIFFRNVLIYFSEQQKKEIMGKIRDALRSEGTLFLGSSELFQDYRPAFSMATHQNGIYYQLEA